MASSAALGPRRRRSWPKVPSPQSISKVPSPPPAEGTRSRIAETFLYFEGMAAPVPRKMISGDSEGSIRCG